jgi:glycosyltransferase A (GT-A) superfamily protein (DUF2064 family)
MLALIQRLSRDRRWETDVAVAPDAATWEHLLPGGVARVAQSGGDLGLRMQRIFDALPAGPVVIVGADIPGIDAAHIANAFRLLGRHDAVFGPAADGGYWLVGLRRRPCVPRPFAHVRWSTAHALEDTLRNLAGYSVALVDTLADVDTGRDLAGAAATFGRRVRPLVLRLGD